METGPVVFIASSIRNETLVDSVARQLADCATPRVWSRDEKAIAAYVLEWVSAQASESDFGVFIFAPDDRWGNQVNGNVLLELGMFIARLGRERCLILSAQGMELPSDVEGIVTARYDPAAFAALGDPALVPAMAAIRSAITGRRNLAQLIRGVWLEEKDSFKSEGALSLVEFYVQKGEFKVRGRSYDDRGEEMLTWPDAVDYAHVIEERRELWHTFDARFGRGGRNVAVGVTCFQFDTNDKTGKGHFVVSGEGRIQQGLITFTLQRVVSDKQLSLDNKDDCQRLILNFLAARAAPRD